MQEDNEFNVVMKSAGGDRSHYVKTAVHDDDQRFSILP